MTAVGIWKVNMSTPMGPQDMQLDISSQDTVKFAARISSAMGKFDVVGSVAGNTLRCEMKANKPTPMTVTFVLEFTGDELRGSAKLDILGKSEVTGNRVIAATPRIATDKRSHDEVEAITGESLDPRYAEPYIAIDELRTNPVQHRYVQGGFKNSDARFSFYFPPKEQYRGRFFHNTYPMITHSDVGPFPIQFEVATGDIGFTMDSGAYYVQTNLGGTDRAPPADPAIAAYRVNAAAAKFSRVVAADLYGEHRPYGYLFGGSGGSYQVMGAAENTAGVWDGFLPYVLGSTNSTPNCFTIRLNPLRVLRQGNKFAGVMDALDPGGSGDPYAALNEDEAAALREATLFGYPLRGWWNHETLTSGYFANVAPLVPLLDPTYSQDFWSKPGYLGTSDPSLQAARFTFETSVAEVVMLDVTNRLQRHVVLIDVPDRDFADAHLVILSGAAAGKSIPIATIDGKKMGFAFSVGRSGLAEIEPGDQVRIDNSWALALQTYHRHQVPPSTELYGWNQYRGANGQPIYPQRDILIGPIGASNTAGRIPQGRITSKVLVIEAMADIDALPWQADWYRSKVKEALGPQFENSFALWFIENAQHDNPLTCAAQANTVSFAGALQQGLRDLSTWVETGKRPTDTQYEVIDTQIVVPASADARGGIQPVVKLQANDGQRADVALGELVHFTGTIEVPRGMGVVVAAEWDFKGTGNMPVPVSGITPAEFVEITATHAFARSGTYFAVLKVIAQRQGDAQTAYARVENMARVRVVVT